MPTYIHDADGHLMAWAPDDKAAELDGFTPAVLAAKGWTKVAFTYPADVQPDASHWDVAAKKPYLPKSAKVL